MAARLMRAGSGPKGKCCHVFVQDVFVQIAISMRKAIIKSQRRGRSHRSRICGLRHSGAPDKPDVRTGLRLRSGFSPPLRMR